MRSIGAKKKMKVKRSLWWSRTNYRMDVDHTLDDVIRRFLFNYMIDHCLKK